MNIDKLRRTRPIFKYLLALCVLCLALPRVQVGAQTTTATGKIAFVSTRDAANESIYVMNLDGTSLLNLTPNTLGKLNRQPSVSPDGTKVVFVSNRDSVLPVSANTDIYVINVDGTGLTRLTVDSINTEPCFSGDGTKIIWTKGAAGTTVVGNLWTMNADGTVQTPFFSLQGRTPSWSADNSKILFSGIGVPVIVNANGVQALLQPNGIPASATRAAINRDGTSVAYNGPGLTAGTSVSLTVTTFDATTAVSNTLPGAQNPFFSPNGTRLVFQRSNGIFLATASGFNDSIIQGTTAFDTDPSIGGGTVTVTATPTPTAVPGATPTATPFIPIATATPRPTATATPAPGASIFYQVSTPYADSAGATSTTTAARAFSLADILPGTSTAYQLFRWNPVSQSYVSLTETSILRRGEGYFVAGSDVNAVVRQPSAEPRLKPLAGSSFEFTLRKGGTRGAGWNMIGFPFDPSRYNSASWDDARVTLPNGRVYPNMRQAVGAGVLGSGLYVFDSATSRYRLAGTSSLQPFQGYWVRTFIDGVRVRLTASGL